MRAVIQKVKKASVSVDNKLVSEIGYGFMILLGVKDTCLLYTSPSPRD